jgi:Trm5-related predicted tRNA methylase
MNTLIENRERASRKRERFCKRLNKTIVLNKNDQEKSEDVTLTPMRESITKLDSTIAYLNSEIASCQEVLMAYDEEQQSNELIQGPDPQFIVDCVTDIDELRYLLTKLIEQTIEKVRVLFSERKLRSICVFSLQGFEADEANELMSYVDLVETMLVKKEDMKPAAAAARVKKATTNTCQDDSMDTTPIPEDSPSSKTMILRPLCNSPTLSNYQTEPMCSD